LFSALAGFSFPAYGAGSASSPVQTEQIEQLIETLETPEKREALISQLRLLIEQTPDALSDTQSPSKDSEKNAINGAIGETLKVEESLSSLEKTYRDLLQSYGINGNTVFKLLFTFLWLGIGALAFYLLRRLHLFLKKQGEKIKNRFSLAHHRFSLYAKIIKRALQFIVAAIVLYAILTVWGLNVLEFLGRDFVFGFFGLLIDLLIILVLAALVWETISTFIEYRMKQADGTSAARLRTLLPIVRNILFIVLLCLLIFIILAEIGINIIPLLAGAGVLGIAIGFGAQTLVQDFLTGFTIILEDLIHVGDVVKVGERSGLVEKITMRKIQLRDFSGAVYTVPFSEVKIIDNLTKDFSFYVFDIGISYQENVDRVIGILKEIDEEMRADEKFGPLILAPLEIFGVDRFADSAVIIKARIKTKPIQQWTIGREFNGRMKIKFDSAGVEIPFPQRTIHVRSEGAVSPAILKQGSD